MSETKHSPAPWGYEYSPYTAQDGREIPAYQVNDAEGNKVFDSNEDREPGRMTHTDAPALCDPTRCPVCDWLMAPSPDEGCVPGNCCYRPAEGTPEYHRIQERKAQ